MYKRLIIFGLLFVMFSACSNSEEKVGALEGELADLYAKLDERENELDEAHRQLEGQQQDLKEAIQQLEGQEGYEDEYIKISKEEAPRLWRDADTQIWEYVRDFSMTEENGWMRGTTEWRDWEGDADHFYLPTDESWETPTALMYEWMLEEETMSWLGLDVWETTLRIEYPSEYKAVGYILNYGFKDDSVAGRDMKLTMHQNKAYWYLDEVKVRDQCARNVSEDKDLCS
ncbi:hypothetical protein LGQ02_01745 [Bacillus shivajii]|uniref:hypothetical protein n=1 Tax=Bacillus shivajii TaxID=1983719 RepID=UPI001CF9D223|nr:hypothetical protein [Bacillus shivajii]UCZ53546.1 hypothetical protein LGQ02_01745 [Bacillus shivajii]